MQGSILFLGTGSILGTPFIGHILKNTENLNKNITEPFCKICYETINCKNNKNIRNPFSIIVISPKIEESFDEKDQDNFLFEICSSFRISMLKYAVPLNIKKISSIFCLNSNESSFSGIDEVREIQEYDRPVNEYGIRFYSPKKKIPIYMTSSALHNFNEWYNYIIKYSLKNDLFSKTKIGCVELNLLDPRNSPNFIKMTNIESLNSFIEKNDDHHTHLKIKNEINFNPIIINYSSNIKITSLFFLDIDNLISSGYYVEYNLPQKSSICIIPKYSTIPYETIEYIKAIPFINILIIPITPNDLIEINQHSITETINFCKSINCNRVYLYNINCSNDHDYTQNIINKNITKDCNFKITIAFDSLLIPILEVF